MFGSHALLLDCFDKTNVPIIIALERIRIVLFFGYKILIVTVIDTSFQKIQWEIFGGPQFMVEAGHISKCI